MADLLAKNLEITGFPVTLAFSQNSDIFVSERVGRLWHIKKQSYKLIYHFPVVPLLGHNETGLLGIAADPDFSQNGYVYCYYTAGKDEKDMKNRVVRINVNKPVEEILLDDIPAGMIHNGGIIAFGSGKTLYIGVGVSDEVMKHAQDKTRLDGKVLRINRDGSIPNDNPIKNSPVFSWGHRNIFGLAFHPKTGTGYICDVGPDKYDEINVMHKGANYGWPAEMGPTKSKKTVAPIKSYKHVITPTQCVAVGKYLYFGSFNEGTVHRLTLSGEHHDKVTKDEIVYKGAPFGVVGVFRSPDGKFYVTTPQAVINITSKLK
jgi:glucose/arabinose dehydrogenase